MGKTTKKPTPQQQRMHEKTKEIFKKTEKHKDVKSQLTKKQRKMLKKINKMQEGKKTPSKKTPSKKMEGSAKNNLHYLSLWGNTSRSRRKLLIQLANRGEIYALCECIDNVLRGTVPITEPAKKVLEKYKKYLRFVRIRKNSLKTRKGILEKYSALLTLIIPAAVSVLRRAFNL